MTATKSLFFVPSDDPTAIARRFADAAKEAPLVTDAVMGLPVVLRKHHLAAIFKDPVTFTTRMFAAGILKGGLAAMQGEEHVKMRRIYNLFFTPKAVERYEGAIVRPIVTDIVEGLKSDGPIDLIDPFCMEMPKRVISALFGLPMDQLAENDARVRDMFRSIIQIGNPEAAAAGQRAYEEALGQITEVAEREMTAPGDTLLGEIVRTLQAEGMMSLEAVQQIVLSLLLGGYETTIWLMTNSLYALLSHPEALAAVRADLTLLPAAIEESMRWAPSNVGTLRMVERPFEMDELKLAPGTVFYCAQIAQNYDEETYARPAVYDINRRVQPQIFGGGIHYCVGAPLARMEARVALSLLLQRFPGLRLDASAPPTWMYGVRGSVAHGPDKLSVFLQ
ncbi:MAG: cytochrome P450 [Byssovorax sp.]